MGPFDVLYCLLIEKYVTHQASRQLALEVQCARASADSDNAIQVKGRGGYLIPHTVWHGIGQQWFQSR
jgi:hypothetical protein